LLDSLLQEIAHNEFSLLKPDQVKDGVDQTGCC